MLDPAVTSLGEKLIGPQIAEHDEALRREIRTIQQQMAARGAVGSGSNMQAVRDACLREVAARAQLIYNQLFRALYAIGFSASSNLARDLKREFDRLLRENVEPLHRQLTAVARRIGMVPHEDELDKAFEHASEKFGAEIEVAVATMMRSADVPAERAAVLHFHGAVGAVLTGSAAHADIHQTITSEDRSALTVALEQVLSDLAKSEGLPDQTRSDLPGVIADVKGEASKEPPNLLRLKSGAVAIATSIQTVGALQPAYSELKNALLPFGITLP